MGEELRRLQLIQLEILKLIDAFCRKHHIHYSLYAGSLLGAVRHHGFIPWDDDLDIFMTRHEYNRFIMLWSMEPHDGFILQNKETDPKFTQSFSKIRKDHTTFLQYEWERGRYHTGIFVDIFPVDRIPKRLLPRLVFITDCMLYQLYTREFIPSQVGIVTKAICAAIMNLSSEQGRKKLREMHYRRIVRYNQDHQLPMICIETTHTLRQILPKNLMQVYTHLLFEDMSAMCIKEWDTYLTIKYNDYLKIPDREERGWMHHPIVLDFDRNLEDIL